MLSYVCIYVSYEKRATTSSKDCSHFQFIYTVRKCNLDSKLYFQLTWLKKYPFCRKPYCLPWPPLAHLSEPSARFINVILVNYICGSLLENDDWSSCVVKLQPKDMTKSATPCNRLNIVFPLTKLSCVSTMKRISIWHITIKKTFILKTPWKTPCCRWLYFLNECFLFLRMLTHVSSVPARFGFLCQS